MDCELRDNNFFVPEDRGVKDIGGNFIDVKQGKFGGVFVRDFQMGDDNSFYGMKTDGFEADGTIEVFFGLLKDDLFKLDREKDLVEVDHKDA